MQAGYVVLMFHNNHNNNKKKKKKKKRGKKKGERKKGREEKERNPWFQACTPIIISPIVEAKLSYAFGLSPYRLTPTLTLILPTAH